MMDNCMLEYLREKYPGVFEGWDEFEISITTRRRKDREGEILVTLYNENTGDYVVDLYACFLITSDDNGQDTIRTGQHELAQEFMEIYIPEFAKS